MTVELDNTYDITGPSTDGAHTLNVYSTDINEAGSMAVFTFTVDGTDPVITLTSPTNNTSVDVGTVVDLVVSDTNLATVSISVDGGASTAFASPYDYTLSVAGSIQLEITAVDAAGNSVSLVLVYTVVEVETSSPTTSEETTAPGFTMIYALMAGLLAIPVIRSNKSR